MIDFEFEQSPWEAFLESQKTGSVVSAAALLSVLEGETDEAVEDAFQMILERDLILDAYSLPKTGACGQAALRLKQEEELVQSGMRLRDLDANDPLRLYLEEIAAIPAFGDEAVLIQQYLSGDLDTAIALTNLGLSRVVELSQEYVGFGVLLLDLIQEGSIGLWQGIQNYVSGDYAQYRDRMIRNALIKSILLQARSTGLAQKMRQTLQDYRSTDEKLLAELGRNPSLEEIALELHLSREEAETVRKMLDDAVLLQQAEKAIRPEQEEEPEDEMAVEDTAYFQMRQRIQELFSQLSAEDAKLLTLRFGLEKGLPKNAEETARILGTTVNDVTSREAAALAKLRRFQ